jgi:cytochrome c oxidase assembly protein subunit 15
MNGLPSTSDPGAASQSVRRFALIVLAMGLLLIWWGAATTTKQAGMAFADWPLSLGSVNPPGWLSYMVPFLEHSHRLLATAVGLLVLTLFVMVYGRSGKRILEIVLLVGSLAVVFAVFIVAGAERSDAARKSAALLLGLSLSLVPIGWLVWSWAKRGWPLLTKLSALALLMVTTQAILGGLRVTEVSDFFAVLHGCLGQAFICVLLLIVLVTRPGWTSFGMGHAAASVKWVRRAAIVLLSLTSSQLIFGASMRHFHREGLADTGLLRTDGQWIPSFDEPILTVMFLHKANGWLILVAVVGLLVLMQRLGFVAGSGLRHVRIILLALLVQIGLGLAVIATGKHFWLTNFHVLNGLLILALVFILVVRASKRVTTE